MSLSSPGWGRCVLLLLLFLAPAGAQAQQPRADSLLTLSAVLAEVQRRNPTLRARRLRAAARAEQPAQARALPDPTAGGTYQPRPLLTARGYQRTQWRVEQQFPFPGKRRLRGEVAALEAATATAEADALALDLEQSARQAYYRLYRVQEQARLVRAFRAQLEGFEEAATTRYEVGEGTQQAILKAQIERGRLRVRLEALAAERRSARAALARLTGQPRLQEGPVQVAPPAPAPPASVPDAAARDTALEAVLEARPQARALRRSAEQADRRIALAQRAFLPDFTAGLTYFDLGAADLTPAMTGRDALAVSVGVKVPLWQGKRHARVEEAQVERRRTQARLDALRLEVQTTLADLQSRRRRQERQLALLEDTLIPQAETALEATLSAYSAGRTDFLDLLDAERTLFQLQMEREGTYARLLQTTADLGRARGRTASPQR